MQTCILIIEDNEDNLSLMVYLLNCFGYKTLSSMEGDTGLAMVDQNLPDLIICDLGLPGLNGFEIAEQLKANAKLKNIPLIAATANSLVGDENVLLSVGFNGYISKPINPETFVQQIEEFLKPEQRATQALD